MSPLISALFFSLISGLSLGILESAIWLTSTSSPGTAYYRLLTSIQHLYWIPAVLLLVSMFADAFCISRSAAKNILLNFHTYLLRGAMAVCLFAFWILVVAPVIQSILLPLSVGVFWTLLIAQYVLARRGMLLWNAGKAMATAAILTALLVIPLYVLKSSTFNSLLGIRIFSLPYDYPLSRRLPSIEIALASGSLLGISTVIAFITRAYQPTLKRLFKPYLASVLLSVLFFCIHAVQYTAIASGGYSDFLAVHVPVITCTFLSLVIALLSYSLATPGFMRRLLSTTVVSIAIILCIAYISRGQDGRQYYYRALQTTPHQLAIYIHINPAGWSRTIHVRSDDTKSYLCDKLINGHPDSIYRADALLLKAASLYEEWRFSDCERVLRQLNREYPDCHGINNILLLKTYAVQGKHSEAVDLLNLQDPTFQEWCHKAGAAQVARELSCSSYTRASLAFDTYYVDYLRTRCRGIWTESAIQRTERRIDSILTGSQPPSLSSVTGSVFKSSLPLSSVRIALVNPSVDASSPADSMLFAGSKTLPLWSGFACVTDDKGRFSLYGVPEGEYDLIIGLNIPGFSDGWVLQRQPAQVTVNGPKTILPPIRFIPSVRCRYPRDGQSVPAISSLSWERYPGAAYYSVSVLAEDAFYSTENAALPASIYTCWSATGIHSTSTALDRRGFKKGKFAADEYKARSLLPGRKYMWFVSAYDKNGRLISTSEHYRLGREPIFTILSEKKNASFLKGGV